MSYIEGSSQPRCKVYFRAGQTIPTGTPTILTFDEEEFNVGDLHDTSINPTRITIPVDGGLWLIHAQAQFQSGSDTGSREVRILANGATIVAQAVVARGGGVINDTIQVTVVAQPGANDYYEVQVQQSSGVNKSVNAGVGVTFLDVVRLW